MGFFLKIEFDVWLINSIIEPSVRLIARFVVKITALRLRSRHTPIIKELRSKGVAMRAYGVSERSTVISTMKGSQDDKRKPPLAVIPYVSCVSERIRKAYEKFDLRVAFKSGPTLRSLLTNVKDPLPNEKLPGAVYQIPCQCGEVYIGEMQRRESKSTGMHVARGTRGSLP